MAHQQVGVIFKYLGSNVFVNSCLRSVSTSSVRSLDQRWREKRGLPLNPNTHGVLTDSPDYSYLDGRPTPYGTRQKKRMLRQKELAEQIMQLSGEIDFAVERHKQMQIEEAQRKQEILDNKLKPKGLLLLTKKK